MKTLFWIAAAGFGLLQTAQPESGPRPPYTLVLGVAQDGGAPQAGSKPRREPETAAYAASLAIVDPESGQRWLIDATPDFKAQLRLLDEAFPRDATPGLDGIFLTHAHMGHYLGLAHLGHEAIGAREVKVYAMPRMREYLASNGPWSQLVNYRNIVLEPLAPGSAVALNARIRVTPVPVPHRQEYSEVVGFHIEGPRNSVFYLPDIDSWKQWDAWGERIEDWVARVDLAYLDGTFLRMAKSPDGTCQAFPIRSSARRCSGFRRFQPLRRPKSVSST